MSCVWLIAVAGVAQGGEQSPEVRTVADLRKLIEQREQSADSVIMETRFTGTMFGDLTFEIEGSLRVLGTTHLDASTVQTYSDGMKAETRTVRNEAGVWMWQRDPVQGEVYLHVKPAKLAMLESARQALGDEAGPGGFGGTPEGPFGGALLDDFAARFDLKLKPEPAMFGDEECWAIAGEARGPTQDQNNLPRGDRAELFVRKRDAAVVKITEFAEDEPLTAMEIKQLVLGQPQDAGSFVLEAPDRAQFIEVDDHPPTRAQFEAVFEQARAKGWTWDEKNSPKGGQKPDKSDKLGGR